MNDDDDSSEGIVASSDDEVDPLSKAVEHHIFHREEARPPYNDEFRTKPMAEANRGGPYDKWGRHCLQDPQHANFYRQGNEFRYFDNPPSARPYRDGWWQPPSPPFLRDKPYFHHIPKNLPHRAPGRYLTERPVDTDYRLNPPYKRRPDIDRRTDDDNQRGFHPRYPENHVIHKPGPVPGQPPYINDNHRRYSQNETCEPYQFPPDKGYVSDHLKDSRVRAPVNDRKPHVSAKKRQGKAPKKPVSFKIKPTKSDEKQYHPLDRLLSSASPDNGPLPGRWIHDKYSEEVAEPEKSSKIGSSVEKNKVEVPSTAPSEDNNQSAGSVVQQSTGSPEGLIHAAKTEEDVIYEEQEVIVEDETEIVELQNISSSDDDEELLGLRLQALSSALTHKESKQKSDVKKRSGSRKKRVKNPIHRVSETTSKSAKKKPVTAKKRDALPDERTAKAKRHVSERTSRSKPDPTQLTLLGEMVKNHHPAKSKILEKIKNKPHHNKKSKKTVQSDDMKLHESASAEKSPETTKGKEFEKDESHSKEQQEENAKETSLEDNYEEMEMELDGADSDTGLLPPGIEQSETSPARTHPDAIRQPTEESSKVPTENATPSQESIWSMLEHSIKQNLVDSEGIVQPPIIAKIHNPEQRRTSFEEFDDDDAILKLRQSLLKQLDHATEKENAVVEPVPVGESAALPSQFPYKPPELTIVPPKLSAISASELLKSASAVKEGITKAPSPTTTSPESKKRKSDNAALTFDDKPIAVGPISANIDTPTMFAPLTASTPANNHESPALRKRNHRKIGKQQTPIVTKSEISTTVISTLPENHASPPVASKTVVKTATTIIRSNAASQKRSSAFVWASDSAKSDTVARIGGSAEMLPLALPKHDPVVVCIGSSDEEESSLAVSKSEISESVDAENDTVSELLKQVRMQTSVKQNANTGNNVSESIDVSPKTAAVSSKLPQNQTVGSNATGARDPYLIARTRFLKYRSLIKKDERKMAQVKSERHAKSLELKAVDDELKQIAARIAAVKSKKMQCQEIVKRLHLQELQIKNRLKKRNAVKNALEAKLKQQKRAIRTTTATTITARKLVNVPKENVPTVAAGKPSPVKITKLNEKKQRLLAMQEKLAEKISLMKKLEANPGSIVRKRASLSNEVESHLAKYRKTRHARKPSTKDLSLNKIELPGSMPHSPASQQLPPTAAKEDSGKMEDEPNVEKQEDKSDINKESISISEVSLALRKRVKDSIVGYKPFDLYNPILSYDHQLYASKFWEPNITDGLHKWKWDGTELPSVSKKRDTQIRKPIDMAYESPLRTFRSYRLNPFYRVKEKLPIKSSTYSHKIETRKMLCKYDLSGKCQDPDCRAQHADQYQMTSDELVLDLLLYCPSLLGEKINSDTNIESLITMSQVSCSKLLGPTHKNMTIDDKCVLIASKINSKLGNKPPFTTICKLRPVRLKQHKGSFVSPVSVQIDDIKTGKKSLQEDASDHPDIAVEQEERYFAGGKEPDSERLESAVKKEPQNTKLWIQLTDSKLKANNPDRLELALHTICLALEENPYSGELWAHYLGLMHSRQNSQQSEDLDEMVAQAIDLVPLSTDVWNTLLSWRNDIMKYEMLLNQLFTNLIKSAEETEENCGCSREFISGWLLETVLRTVQLQLYRGSVNDPVQIFSSIISTMLQQRRWAIDNSGVQCLTPIHLNVMKLCQINVKHFKCLPACLTPDLRSTESGCLPQNVKLIPDAEVQLHFSSTGKLPQESFTSLLDDINVAIEECNVGETVNVSCMLLLWEKLRLLRTQECWMDALELSRFILEKVELSLVNENLRFGFSLERLDGLLIDCIIMSADCLAKHGSIEEATQTFENTINESKNVDGRLCYEAALLQRSTDTDDVEAVLGYLEASITPYFKSESDCLDASSIKLMLRSLLRLALPFNQKLPQFASDMSWDRVKKDKSSLWLMYCLLLHVTGYSVDGICEYYEEAIRDVTDIASRKELWLRYIRFKQTLAVCTSEPVTAATKTKQQQWLRGFSSLVKRCLLSVTPHLEGARYDDYAFHNQVSSVYLSCFTTRPQITTAYNFLTELMPYNSLLIARACKHHWELGDYHSVVSTVWKIATSNRCQNETLWKISISSLFLIGRIARAVRLAKQALDSLPFSYQLWSDYLSLLNAYGLPAEFDSEMKRCGNLLQVDPRRLLGDT